MNFDLASDDSTAIGNCSMVVFSFIFQICSVTLSHFIPKHLIISSINITAHLVRRKRPNNFLSLVLSYPLPSSAGKTLYCTTSCSSGLIFALLAINSSTSSPPSSTICLVYTSKSRPLFVTSGSPFLLNPFTSDMSHSLGFLTNCLDSRSPKNGL